MFMNSIKGNLLTYLLYFIVFCTFLWELMYMTNTCSILYLYLGRNHLALFLSTQLHSGCCMRFTLSKSRKTSRKAGMHPVQHMSTSSGRVLSIVNADVHSHHGGVWGALTAVRSDGAASQPSVSPARLAPSRQSSTPASSRYRLRATSSSAASNVRINQQLTQLLPSHRSITNSVALTTTLACIFTCTRLSNRDGRYSRYPRYTAVPNFTVLVPWGSRYTVEVTVLHGTKIVYSKISSPFACLWKFILKT